MKEAPTRACLLLHGFGGTPAEMEPLVPALEALGCKAVLPMYPGHGSTLDDFRRTAFPDWLDCAERHFASLTREHDRVLVIGFSMGGSIALSLAAKYRDLPQLAGVVALSPVYDLYQRSLLFRGVGALARGLWRKWRPQESRRGAPYQGHENIWYLPHIISLGKGVRAMKALLPMLRCPLFLAGEVNDRVCPPDAALKIARATASRDVSVRWVRMQEPGRRHMLTMHQDTREAVAAAVAGFAARVML